MPPERSYLITKLLESKELRNGGGMVESVEIAGPGFINIKMSIDFFYSRLLEVADQGENRMRRRLRGSVPVG